MRKLLVTLLAAVTLSANDLTLTSMQSGANTTPIHDRGLRGEGQIIAILDTGADWTSCYLAEPDGSRPPINTGSPTGGLEWRNIDPNRRKIIAYNFLYSCDQYPGARGCDDPVRPYDPGSPANAYDNQGHGTHAAGAAAGDKDTPSRHDHGDGLALAAKLVIQDGGLIYDEENRRFIGDACSQRPGFGCPVNLTPILDQAYKQGVRIHSNSWGDRQGVASGNPPTANYSASARDVDAFVWSHPDMLVVFNTGNFGSNDLPPPSSLSAPGAAKNTIQVGGTRGYFGQADDVLAGYSLVGPTRDGRIKPDVVGPAQVVAADAYVLTRVHCYATSQGGTSWASPTIAGAAALVRQYYTEGWYPSGSRDASAARIPSAALLKATIIAAARRVPARITGTNRYTAEAVPSYEQGFGFPVLDDALYFSGDRRRMRIHDVTSERGLAQGESFTVSIDARTGTELKAVLVWTDPPGHVAGVSNTTPQLVNDLDLRVVQPDGATAHGNERLHPGQPDRINNVEGITIAAPAAGTYTITVSAPRIALGPRQSYALVLTGDFEAAGPARRRSVRR